MRLPQTKIKEAIIHSEKLVRQEALLYFADCSSRDEEVMPLAIRAIETYGRSNAFLHVYLLAQPAQTEATVEWAQGIAPTRRQNPRPRQFLSRTVPTAMQR